MKNSLFLCVIVFIVGLYSFTSMACDCQCDGDCSFVTASGGGLVALVKVLEYSQFLEYEDRGEIVKMPLAINVEVIKKYKGEETRKKIQIWGDDGMLCRPYSSQFKIGKYYLMAPNKIMYNSSSGKVNDYYLFACETSFLEVDLKKRMVYGEYAKNIHKISLDKVEADLNK